MASTTPPPRVKFYQNHRPAMDPGEYSIRIESSISHANISSDNTSTVVRRFAVFGERFALAPKDIGAVFPAADSTGEYSAILPHVIFDRNTLPWERHANPSNKELPWTALLLFDEGEAPGKKVITVKELYSAPLDAGHFPSLPREVAQTDDERLTVIDVSRPLLEKVLPSTESLLLLAHTRQGIDENDNLVGDENAVVFCDRLPEQGRRSTMHLVSLERRYNEQGFDYTGAGDLIRLVSLKSWDFYTIEHFKIADSTLKALQTAGAPADQVKSISTLLYREFAGTEDQFLAETARAAGLDAIPDSYKKALIDNSRFDKTFDGLLNNLNKEILSLRLPQNHNKTAENFLSQGFVPLRHQFRTGDVSVSWYRSPFVPVRGINLPNPGIHTLYPEHADELLQFDNATGMFDVTYSVAWEVGRLLALSNKDFSVNLAQWKRLVAHHLHRKRQAVGNEHLPLFMGEHHHEKEKPIWEQHLLPWFERLATSESIPANYLIPDAGLLPAESIRFFDIDPNWRAAAICGAFSIGGAWEKTQQEDDQNFLELLNWKDPYTNGFMIRSDVVDGWPGLLIDGVLENGQVENPLRRRLSRDILLCQFKNKVSKVVFHQKPEVMHFGFLKENEEFFKRSRNEEGDEVGSPISVPWKSKDQRVVNISQMAKDLSREWQVKWENKKQPAHFAMNMIEGIPRVRFSVENA